MDERIDPVDPEHYERAGHEIGLDGWLPEYAELLLERDYLEGVVSCGVDGAFDYEYCCCCAAELVYLYDFKVSISAYAGY